jgi:hypothetical protein
MPHVNDNVIDNINKSNVRIAKELLAEINRRCARQDNKGFVNVEFYDDKGTVLYYKTFDCEGRVKEPNRYKDGKIVEEFMNRNLFSSKKSKQKKSKQKKSKQKKSKQKKSNAKRG